MGHDEADFLGSVKFPGAGDAAFGKLTNEVLVGAADDIRLHVSKTKLLFADPFDKIGQAVIGQVPDAVGGGVKIYSVDDPLKQGIFVGDSSQMGGELLPDLVRQLTDYRPDRFIGVGRFQGQVKSDQLFVMPDQFEGLGPRSTSSAIRLISSSNTSHSRLAKISGRI